MFELADRPLAGSTILDSSENEHATELIAKPGAYRAGGTVYVGIEAEPPDHPTIQYYHAATQRIGTLESISGHEYRSDGSPKVTFILDTPISPIAEERFVIEHGAGRLGASLWHTSGAERSSTILLIHGADDETRAMGFLIPYFVSHGLNVITYDQRGTGSLPEIGDIPVPNPRPMMSSQSSKKLNSIAVDTHRIGVWGFSNGWLGCTHRCNALSARLHDFKECAK